MQLNPFANVQAECGLIGAVFQDASAFYDATQAGITAQSFSDGINSGVWQICTDLVRQQKPITRYFVATAIESHGISGQDRMRAYREACPTKEYARAFTADVRRCELARLIKASAHDSISKIDRGDDPAQVVNELQSVIAKDANAGVRVRSLREIRSEKVETWKAAVGQGFVGIPSGFAALNEYMGGYRRGCMTVLGGYRGEGKSTLARQEATSIAMRGIPVGIITMEDPDTVAGSGVAGNLGEFSVYHLDIGQSEHCTPEEANERWAKIEHLPMHFADSPQTIQTLVNTMTMLVLRHGCQWIMIDHIQYILPSGRVESRNVEVQRMSGAIAASLRRLDIPGLVLSQLSRDSEKNSHEPRLSDLRDSGAIEQDARAVMLLSRDADNPLHHRLRIAKNNFGPSGKVLRLARHDGRQRFDFIGVAQ